MVPILGGEPCVSYDRLQDDGLTLYELGSNEWNKNFRLKYKHSNKEEIKKQIKAERAKARKNEITSSSFNERLGLEAKVTKIALLPFIQFSRRIYFKISFV